MEINLKKREMIKKAGIGAFAVGAVAMIPSVLADPKLFRDDGADAFLIDNTGNRSFVDLSVDTLTEGSVMFTGVNGLISQDNANFFWDDTNDRLGIGTATPTEQLEVAEDVVIAGLSESLPIWTDTNKKLISGRATTAVPIVFSTYDAEPSRGSESNIHGGLLSLAVAQPLNSLTDIVITKGTGKFIVSINAGTDVVGTINIVGNSVDRETGEITVGDTDSLTIDVLSSDDSTTDANGNTVHDYTNVYITNKWFTGTVTLSTTDLTITSADVLHVSFEQSNDAENLHIQTFDVNLLTTNIAAEFDAYLYTLHKDGGNKCHIDPESELHVGAEGQTAIANMYWRLRKGNLDEAMNGLTDGFWVDMHYSNSPAYVEDVSMKVWMQQTITATARIDAILLEGGGILLLETNDRVLKE